MENKNILQAIELISRATGINKDTLQEELQAIEFDKWDSLSNLRIVIALEKKIKKKLNSTLVSKIDSVKSVAKLLS